MIKGTNHQLEFLLWGLYSDRSWAAINNSERSLYKSFSFRTSFQFFLFILVALLNVANEKHFINENKRYLLLFVLVGALKIVMKK